VPLAFDLEVGGIDAAGQLFRERAKTTTVSRYGCCLEISRPLEVNQRLQVIRTGARGTARARVVSAVGATIHENRYGLEMIDACDELWGVRFSSSDERLVDTLQDGIYFVDRERKIVYWNEGAERLSGYSAAQAAGKHCYDNLLRHTDSSGRLLCTDRCPLRSVMLDGQPREVNIWLRHQDGHKVAVSVSASPLRNSAGRIVGAIELFHETEGEGKENARSGERGQHLDPKLYWPT